MDKKLTPKEEAFIQIYCSNGFNGRQAAKDAGYSENTATEIAYENLIKPHIKLRLHEYQIEQAEKNGVTVAEVISNARYIVTESKNVNELNNLARGNEQLGKVIGAFTENIQQTVKLVEIKLDKEQMKAAIKEVLKSDDL